jgi:hypothetical protein
MIWACHTMAMDISPMLTTQIDKINPMLDSVAGIRRVRVSHAMVRGLLVLDALWSKLIARSQVGETAASKFHLYTSGGNRIATIFPAPATDWMQQIDDLAHKNFARATTHKTEVCKCPPK